MLVQDCKISRPTFCVLLRRLLTVSWLTFCCILIKNSFTNEEFFYHLGCRIEINETGTVLRFVPGIIIGGSITHDCGTSRSIGWFVEAIIPLAPFCKTALRLTLTGITNDDLDLSVDVLSTVTLPLLQNFGIYNATLKIKQRGAPPRGGGLIELSIPPVKAALKSVYLTNEGLVKRVRGVAYCTHISPTLLTRVIDSCREVLNQFLPDVRISTDHFKGKREGGASPGYALSLCAESTTGVLISTERTARCRKNQLIPGTENMVPVSSASPEAPEDVGRDAAFALLEEIFSG
jgi:RNA 3'-terminal phosphate cyclase-like protein